MMTSVLSIECDDFEEFPEEIDKFSPRDKKNNEDYYKNTHDWDDDVEDDFGSILKKEQKKLATLICSSPSHNHDSDGDNDGSSSGRSSKQEPDSYRDPDNSSETAPNKNYDENKENENTLNSPISHESVSLNKRSLPTPKESEKDYNETDMDFDVITDIIEKIIISLEDADNDTEFECNKEFPTETMKCAAVASSPFTPCRTKNGWQMSINKQNLDCSPPVELSTLDIEEETENDSKPNLNSTDCNSKAKKSPILTAKQRVQLAFTKIATGFLCNICGFKTSMRAGIARHISAKHWKPHSSSKKTQVSVDKRNKPAAQTFQCSECPLICRSLSGYTRHFNSKHKNPLRGNLSCDKNAQPTQTPTEVKSHSTSSTQPTSSQTDNNNISRALFPK